MNLTIDLDFTLKHGYFESITLALLRRNEVLRYSRRMSNAHSLFILYPFFGANTYVKTLARLAEQGYLTEEKVYFRGKYPHRLYKLTDKAFKEYNFGE